MEDIPFSLAWAAEKSILDILSMEQDYPGAAIKERNSLAKIGAKENLQMERSGKKKQKTGHPPLLKREKTQPTTILG